MKKKSITYLIMLVCMGITFFSCSSGENGEPEPPVLQPTVSLVASEVSETSLTLTIEPKNAKNCAYTYIKKGEKLPSAETVLASGTQVSASKSSTVTIDKLEGATGYIIIAAVLGEESTAFGQLEMTTKEAPKPLKSHTLVFYLMGNNTGLEKEMDANVQKILTAAVNNQLISDKNHIAIFYDRGNYTRLTEITKEDGRTKQVVIKEYPVNSSCLDPQFMAEVFALVREKMPADSYGLSLSSHGGGWVPSEIYDQYLLQVSTRFFGQDGDDYMEIPQLVEGLKGMHFDYILFDACFMASVEALYDLRETADYIIASPAEVMGGGFPYTSILPLLFTEGHNLEGVCQAFMDAYKNSSGTISLTRCSELNNLANSMKKVLEASASKKVDATTIQGYEGFAPHLYYDLEQYVEALTTDKTLLDNFKSALQKTILYESHTSSFYSGVGPNRGNIQLLHSCGLTSHIENSKYPDTHKAFLKTNWAKSIGAQ